MLPQIFVVLFCSLASVFAVNSRDSCKRHLQSILSTSPSCAENYFAELNDKLRKLSPLLFSSQAESVIENFENTYGVKITTNPPFGYQCNVYSITTPSVISNTAGTTYLPFGNTAGPEGIITSIKVSADVVSSNVNNLRLRLSFLEPITSTQSVLLYSGGACPGSPGIQATFEDGGLNANILCSQLNDGLTLAPSAGSLMRTIVQNKVTATSPIYFGFRMSAGVLESLFRSANLTVCSVNTYSYDIAKSDLNVNGFRYDAGAYYYTSVYRDQYGQMQYVTISSSESSIIC